MATLTLVLALLTPGWVLSAGAVTVKTIEDPPTVVVQPGYAIATARGTVGTFGGAMFAGDLDPDPPKSPVVGIAATPDRRGYFLAEQDGTVLAFGDAHHTAAPIPGPATVAIASDPATGGFYTVTTTGALRAVGAPALPPAHLPRNRGPVIGLALAGDHGTGAWLATAGGAVIGVGTVPMVIPPKNLHNVAAIAPTPDGAGYWVATINGTVTAAGDAPTLKQATKAGTDSSNSVALIPTPEGRGALLVRADGSVQPLGNAVDRGDASSPLHPPAYPKRYQLPPTEAVGGAYLDDGPQAATTGPLRVTFLGDSLSVITGHDTRHYLSAHHQPVALDNGGILGCGITGPLTLGVYSAPGPPKPTLPACAQWAQQYRRSLALSHPDAVVLLLGFWESQRHQFHPHGAVVTVANSSRYRAYLQTQLRSVADMVSAAGAHLVVLTAPYYGDHTPPANVDAFNRLLVSTLPGATVFDLTKLLDPGGHYANAIHGVTVRTHDRVHLTVPGVERVVDPAIVPVMLSAARDDRAAATATPTTSTSASPIANPFYPGEPTPSTHSR